MLILRWRNKVFLNFSLSSDGYHIFALKQILRNFVFLYTN